MAILASLVAAVRAINRKYAQPQIETTAFVKASLLALRLYLLVLIGLMLYKFVRTLSDRGVVP